MLETPRLRLGMTGEILQPFGLQDDRGRSLAALGMTKSLGMTRKGLQNDTARQQALGR